MFTCQIEQRVFAVKRELDDKPTAHNAVSVGLNASGVMSQEIILPAILCAVGKCGNELLHPGIGQVLIGIAGGYIALFAGVAGWGCDVCVW